MSGFADYEQYDALGLADLVRRKDVTPSDLLEAAIERVEARNAAVNAVVMPLYDYGRKAIADGLPDGPFRGVLFLLKDLGGWLAGIKVTRGSRFFADAPAPAADSEHVRRLKRAGLVIFGRTNSCELGLSLTCEPALYGPTKSPWDTTRISGGSSYGAAAAVGAHAPHGSRFRRVRLDPRAGVLLRDRGPQTDAVAQHTGAVRRRRIGRHTCRPRCATASSSTPRARDTSSPTTPTCWP